MTIEDTVSANLRFAGGTLGSYMHTWAHRGWVWEVDCAGEDFRLVWDGAKSRLWGRIKDQVIDVQTDDDFYVTEVNAFLDAVAAGDQSMIRSSYADAAKSLAPAIAINESVVSGRPVTVPCI